MGGSVTLSCPSVWGCQPLHVCAGCRSWSAAVSSRGIAQYWTAKRWVAALSPMSPLACRITPRPRKRRLNSRFPDHQRCVSVTISRARSSISCGSRCLTSPLTSISILRCWGSYRR
ncbi:UNVERIFIED_CONTAM: hypothetical protein GTU68_020907 [Idotea baltica]|nr:hypothetical protein [Idotea baltica]